MKSAELFAGCGGLALGLSHAGFNHSYMVEFNKEAVGTVLHNKQRGLAHIRDWPIHLQDVREIDWKSIGPLDLISGGPPCQPFGIGGKKLGQNDQRDMWPEAIRAIRETKPRFFLFENVRNIAGPRFRPYLNWIVAHLARPDIVRNENESHDQHIARLLSSGTDEEYSVIWQLVNAADFGAAQIRHRVLIFGIRKDQGVHPSPMSPTHSRDKLLWDQYISGKYWEKHGLRSRQKATMLQDQTRVDRMRAVGVEPEGLPWVTLRDALKGLGEPDGKSNHILQPGAKVYPGHTGSLLDLPAKALKAGDHGVPGGENMMVKDDGSVRYFTTREAARLVGLPDDFEFPGAWSVSMRQLGNAVPSQLGAVSGRWLNQQIESSKSVASVRRVA